MTGNADESDEIRRVFASRDRNPNRRWAATGYRVLTAERRTLTLDLLRRELRGRVHPAILDVGCGAGLDVEWWMQQGWPAERLAGIDLVEDRILTARARSPGVDLRLGDGRSLPFADDAFDVATAATVFSSILRHESRRALFAEIVRIIRPGGLVVIYDFVIRKPGNKDVVAMTERTLASMAGRRADVSIAVSPFLYAVGPAAALHPALGRAVGRILPQTHRLSVWRV